MTTPTPGGPWTRHGHPIAGITVAGGHPPLVARCGGPGLCSQCALDAERIRAEHRDPIEALRWRVEQLEIENRTHARMDTRLAAVERWIEEHDAVTRGDTP